MQNLLTKEKKLFLIFEVFNFERVRKSKSFWAFYFTAYQKVNARALIKL